MNRFYQWGSGKVFSRSENLKKRAKGELALSYSRTRRKVDAAGFEAYDSARFEPESRLRLELPRYLLPKLAAELASLEEE